VSSRKRSLQAKAAALALVLFVGAPSVGQAERRDVTPASAPDLSSIHIDNFGRVSSNYFRGAEPDDEQYATLAAVGIKTVIDLRSDDFDTEDRLLVERAGMKYVQIPMTTHQPPTRPVIEEFLRIVDDPENQPVYVHCVGGRHRTGVMTAVYRMTRDGWTADQAFKEMKAYKFGADFLHPEFKRFVYAYHATPALVAKAGE
jgi:protein tyrosine/serine phosphatase